MLFVVVSRRQDFSRQCADILGRWGTVRFAGAVSEVCGDGSAPPALVVVDATIDDSPNPTLIQQWLRACGGGKLVLADAALAPLDELAALAAGAVACCNAGLAAEEFERVIDVVLHGGVWVSKAAIPLLMTKLQTFSQQASAAPASAPATDGLDGLTGRQREVALMVGRGASNKQIARALDISDRTVKAHLTSIFEKLGINDRLQLALHVNRSGGNDARP